MTIVTVTKIATDQAPEDDAMSQLSKKSVTSTASTDWQQVYGVGQEVPSQALNDTMNENVNYSIAVDQGMVNIFQFNV